MKKEIIVILFVLSLILLTGCAQVSDKTATDRAYYACEHLEASEDHVLTYYPRLADISEKIADELNADKYQLISSQLSSYSYETEYVSCKAEIDVCSYKTDYEECVRHTIYFPAPLKKIECWQIGKTLFN